ncbi:hypothetical protein EDD37DRAFT_267506 [Exophiala viscosa]|uniref:uncharacterized protein n=1 Tax=Exophiala viscosa TaxID=2486360 RepID=UPI0021960493|nr:hypothetical protein EDD37DRAFT_267506 [Exophiala viscosa]
MASSTHSRRELHFVTIDSTKPRPSADAKQRKSLRAFVMRDYLRQKNDPSWEFAPAKVDSRMDSHISRFRSAKPASTPKPKRRNRELRRVHTHPSTHRARRLGPAPPGTNESVPGPLEAEHSSRISPIHDLDMLDPFQTLQVDLSTPETQSLLQYYRTSFWANSYACNPEGRWMSVALMDPAIIHATLSLVAIHRRDCYSIDLSREYFRHRGEAMRLIASRMSDPDQATRDATIGAVAILSSSDQEFEWPAKVQTAHSVGLADLIALRGGIDNLSSNRHIQRVAGWSDMLHSAMHGTRLRVKMPRVIAESKESIIGTPASGNSTNPWPAVLLSDLPSCVANILRRVRVLSSLKSFLVTDRNPELRRTFSGLLWKLEYSILELHDDENGEMVLNEGRGIFRNQRMNMAVGLATLIFSYSSLRNLVAPVLYDKLRARLRICLSSMDSFASDSAPSLYLGFLEGGELAIMLWVLHLGLHGPYTHEADKRWFADKLAQLCWNNGILSYASAKEKLQSVVPQAHEAMMNSEQDWEQVEVLMWEDIIKVR